MVYNEGRGGWWPSSAAFVPSTGDQELSVYLESEVAALNLPIHSVAEGHEGYAVLSFPAALARSLERGVVRDPTIESPRPLACDPAHALITGRETDGDKAWRRVGRRVFASDSATLVKEASAGQMASSADLATHPRSQ
jgi:hypothetical protein